MELGLLNNSKKFIKHLRHNVNSKLNCLVGKLKSLNHEIKQIDEKSMSVKFNRNIYELTIDYVFFVLQYGIPITFVLKYYKSNSFVVMVFVTGIIYWIMLKTINNVKKQITGEI